MNECVQGKKEMLMAHGKIDNVLCQVLNQQHPSENVVVRAGPKVCFMLALDPVSGKIAVKHHCS